MTREERLNNPGGIKHSPAVWVGQSPDQPDSVFVKFQAPRFGIRAIVKTLESYVFRDGITTLGAAIERWAPPVENDTQAYIADVCQRCGSTADSPLKPKSPAVVRAIIIHENGECIYPDSVLTDGINLA